MRLFSCEQKHGILFFGQKVVRKVSQYKFSSGTKKSQKDEHLIIVGCYTSIKNFNMEKCLRAFFLLKTTTKAQFIRSTNFSKSSTFVYFSVLK